MPPTAIYWAAHADRRELYVGRSALKTIWGNKLAPWLVDRYLARTAYHGQFADLDYDPDRPDNLSDPVPGDPGARGPFDERAAAGSLQLSLSKHRRAIGLALAVAAVGDDDACPPHPARPIVNTAVPDDKTCRLVSSAMQNVDTPLSKSVVLALDLVPNVGDGETIADLAVDHDASVVK